MAMVKIPKEDWSVVDTATLPKELAKMYADYKAAYAKVDTQRKAFDAALIAHIKAKLPEGKRAVIAHNWGNLNVAITDAATASTPRKAKSLADLI